MRIATFKFDPQLLFTCAEAENGVEIVKKFLFNINCFKILTMIRKKFNLVSIRKAFMKVTYFSVLGLGNWHFLV